MKSITSRITHVKWIELMWEDIIIIIIIEFKGETYYTHRKISQ